MSWEPPEMETLQDQARMLHELHTSLINEGFTEHQALHIVMGQPCCQLNRED
jgi:hypothetical protein